MILLLNITMANEEDKTPTVSEEEFSDDEADAGDVGDAGDTGVDQSQTVEDATDFALDEPTEELCDYEMIDEMQLDQYHSVTHSSTIHTTEYITKYEKTRVLGWRAQHIKSGAAPMIREDEKNEAGDFIFKDGKYPRESYAIALKELEYGRCPVIIGRRIPNGEKIMIRVSQLRLI
jgi:DNA-directed RNA polymerase subunit K/omega